jgi:hypothetical protein
MDLFMTKLEGFSIRNKLERNYDNLEIAYAAFLRSMLWFMWSPSEDLE